MAGDILSIGPRIAVLDDVRQCGSVEGAEDAEGGDGYGECDGDAEGGAESGEGDEGGVGCQDKKDRPSIRGVDAEAEEPPEVQPI